MDVPALSNQRAVSVGEFLAMLWVWKYRAAASMFLGAVLMFGASFLVTRQYRATVLMLPVEQQAQSSSAQSLLRQFGGVASAAGISIGGASDQKNEGIAILKSRSFLEAFISSHGLQQALADQGWSRWFGSADESIGDAYRVFSRRVLRINEDVSTGVVELAVTWRDRSVVADWANALYEGLNREMRDREISQAKQSMEFLQKELESTSVEGVRHAIYNLMEGQVGKVMLANVNEEFVFRRLDGAHMPEADETVSPIRILWAVVGGTVGFLLVCMLSALRAGRQGIAGRSGEDPTVS